MIPGLPGYSAQRSAVHIRSSCSVHMSSVPDSGYRCKKHVPGMRRAASIHPCMFLFSSSSAALSLPIFILIGKSVVKKCGAESPGGIMERVPLPELRHTGSHRPLFSSPCLSKESSRSLRTSLPVRRRICFFAASSLSIFFRRVSSSFIFCRVTGLRM